MNSVDIPCREKITASFKILIDSLIVELRENYLPITRWVKQGGKDLCNQGIYSSRLGRKQFAW